MNNLSLMKVIESEPTVLQHFMAGWASDQVVFYFPITEINAITDLRSSGGSLKVSVQNSAAAFLYQKELKELFHHASLIIQWTPEMKKTKHERFVLRVYTSDEYVCDTNTDQG